MDDGLSWRGLKGNNELTSVSASKRTNGGLWTRRLLTTVVEGMFRVYGITNTNKEDKPK